MPPWDRYAQQGQAPAPQQAQPQGDTIIRAAPQPDAIEQERLRIAQDANARAAAEAQRNAQGNPGVGYRIGPDGNAQAIPGGPADPNTAQNGVQGNAVPLGAATRAETDIGSYTSLSRVLGGFQDAFAGNTITGNMENTAQAYLGTGTPGQSEWWADFRTLDNQIRNDLFGATLTPSEQRAYSQTSIDPRMTPEKVRANLQRRMEVVRGALTRRRDFYLANGYREDAVNALFAPLLEGEFANGQAQTDQRDDTPPALGGAVAPATGPTAGPPPAGAGPTPAGDGRILGNTHNNGLDNEQQGIARTSRSRQDNPVLGGVQQEYLNRLGRGETAEQITAWARTAGIDESALPSIQAQVQFRDENPNVALSEYDVAQLDDRFVNVDPLAQGLGNVASLPLGAYAANAADALTGFSLDSLIGATGGNAEQARNAIDQTGRENPTSALLGNISGGTLAALGLEGGLAARGVTAGVGRALAADSAYGAAAGAGMSDYAADGTPATAWDRATGAAMGAVAGAAGSGIGQMAGRGLAAGARGVGNRAVQTMQREGIPLTVGQTFGGTGRVGNAVRAVEDRLSGVPIVGDAIKERATEGLRRFNNRIFDKVLEPIGGQIGDLVGSDAVEEAQRQVSQSFTDALQGVGIVPDRAFERDLAGSVMGIRALDERTAPGLFEDIADVFAPYADEQMLTGEALQTIHRELRDIRLAYRQNPRYRRISAQVEKVERAVFDVFDRQASGTVEGYRNARAAYRRLATVEDVVIKAANQNDQMFTAAQIRRADNASTRRLEGRGAAARGDAPFNDLTKAAQEVLPNKVPDSGTAGRLLVPALLVGGASGGAATGDMTTGLTVGAILGGVYSKLGQRALTRMGGGVASPSVRRLMESAKTRRALGIAGAGGALSANR